MANFFTTNILLWVPYYDYKPCLNSVSGAKILFPVGCAHTMRNFYLLLRKELEGKKMHQNVYKHPISGGRKQNQNS